MAVPLGGATVMATGAAGRAAALRVVAPFPLDAKGLGAARVVAAQVGVSAVEYLAVAAKAQGRCSPDSAMA